MAGDWIPYTFDLPRKREVMALSRLCKMPRREVVAVLLEFWSWASAESADGHIRSVVLDQLPDIIPDTKPASWEQMASPSIGWIIQEDDGLFIPNYQRWLSKSAKARLMERDKKRAQRAADCPDDVPIETGQSEDENGTTGESTGEILAAPPPP